MNDVPQTPPPPPPPSQAGPPSSGDLHPDVASYPVQADIQWQPEYHRWLPLVKWLLAIPHYIVLAFLGIGASIAIFIAFFAVLFTGTYPRGLFDFVLGVFRWSFRVGAYVSLMTDQYPPFSLEDDPGYPARLDIAYPEHVDNWRPLVHWLLAIPYLLVAHVLASLAGLLIFFAFFTILFTMRFPEEMFKIVRVALRWQARGNAYAVFMTTKYPPFVWS